MTSTALAPGLYLVSTPIGAARDITLRALDILAQADLLAAEDTRTTRKLMDIHGIKLGERKLMPYHDHNGATQRPLILDAIQNGLSVAYVSDAGTPLVADPGYRLAKAVMDDAGLVTAAPGASAVLTALAISGLPSDRFMFSGFLPTKEGARRSVLEELKSVPSTLIFFETPKRLDKSLKSMREAFGSDRDIAICRELTKKFEQVLRGSIEDVIGRRDAEMPLKGEIVIVLGPPVPKTVNDDDVDAFLTEALVALSVKDAAAGAAETLGIPRKQAYARAIALSKK